MARASDRGCVMISRVSAVAVASLVADRYGMKLRHLRSASRAEPCVTCRCEAAWVLKQLGLSLNEIGYTLNRDHSTVSSALERVERHFRERVGYESEVRGVLVEARVLAKVPQAQVVDPVARLQEPPIVVLLKTGKDELVRASQAMHRLSMLFDAAIVRLENREEQPIIVNTQRADEVLS